MDHAFPIKCALITGASSGIGLAYAHALAGQKADLVLVGRHHGVLKDLAQLLTAQYGVKVMPAAVDLSDPKAAQILKALVAESGMVLDCLINNAGYADEGPFLDLPWDAHERMLRAMLGSLTALCHVFLPDLLKRERAYLINVASVAGLIHMPFKSGMQRMLYRPIKSYVVYFTEQLAHNYRDQGLVVQALCPGLTVSDFHARSGDQHLRAQTPSWLWSSAKQVVHGSLAALKPGRKTVLVTGWHNRVIVFFCRLIYLFFG